MLELSDSNFYYLELNDKKFVFSNYEKAVKEVKGKIDIDNIDEDDIELDEVKISSDGEWKIKGISWFNFAMELMKQ